jgi:hypothetical protein
MDDFVLALDAFKSMCAEGKPWAKVRVAEIWEKELLPLMNRPLDRRFAKWFLAAGGLLDAPVVRLPTVMDVYTEAIRLYIREVAYLNVKQKFPNNSWVYDAADPPVLLGATDFAVKMVDDRLEAAAERGDPDAIRYHENVSAQIEAEERWEEEERERRGIKPNERLTLLLNEMEQRGDKCVFIPPDLLPPALEPPPPTDEQLAEERALWLKFAPKPTELLHRIPFWSAQMIVDFELALARVWGGDGWKLVESDDGYGLVVNPETRQIFYTSSPIWDATPAELIDPLFESEDMGASDGSRA